MTVMEETIAVPGLPRFLDLEASSLRRDVSFPTEVAWSDNRGGIRSCLIRPESDWTDWSPNAERITGLSRARLLHDGLPVRRVAALMNRELRGSTLYCDGGDHDRFWLDRLFRAAGLPCRFRLEDIGQLIPARLRHRPDWPEQLQAIAHEARRAAGPAHRAREDVVYLQTLYQQVRRRLWRPGTGNVAQNPNSMRLRV